MYLNPRFYLQDKTCLSFLNLFTLINRTFFSSTFSQIISVILGQWKSIVCTFYLSICLEMGIKTASQFCKKSECVNISHVGLEYPFLGLLQGAFSRVTMSESSVSVSKVLCLRRACSRIPESNLLPALSFHMNFSYLLWHFFSRVVLSPNHGTIKNMRVGTVCLAPEASYIRCHREKTL